MRRMLLALLALLCLSSVAFGCPAGETCVQYPGTVPYAISGGTVARTPAVRAVDVWRSLSDVAGIDCTGVTSSSTGLQTAVNAAPDHSTLVAPTGCIINLDSTLLIQGRVDLQLMSIQHPLNISAGANNPPTIKWTGSGAGPVINIVDSTAINIEGFYFSTTTTNTLNTVINIDGDGTVGHQTSTLNMVQNNSFGLGNQTNDSLRYISISATSNSNNENYLIYNNDIRCSNSSAVLRAVDGVTNGTTTVTSATASFISGDATKRVRVSYASGIVDTTVASVTNSTTVVMNAPTWSGATTYKRGNLVTGSDTNLYVSINDTNLNNNPVGGPGGHWVAMWTQTGATVHIGEAFGTGIYQAGGNSFHERYYGNRVSNCSVGFDLTNGSFSIEHYGGGNNDIGVRVGNANGMMNYYDAEHDLQAVTGVNNLIINRMRGTLDNAVANGWISIPSVATLVIEGFGPTESTPPTNFVLFGFPGSVAKVTSINNRYDTTLTFAQVNYCGAAYTAFINDTFKASEATKSGYCGSNGLPTSASGLSSGMIWKNSNVLTVVP